MTKETCLFVLIDTNMSAEYFVVSNGLTINKSEKSAKENSILLTVGKLITNKFWFCYPIFIFNNKTTLSVLHAYLYLMTFCQTVNYIFFVYNGLYLFNF